MILTLILYILSKKNSNSILITYTTKYIKLNTNNIHNKISLGPWCYDIALTKIQTLSRNTRENLETMNRIFLNSWNAWISIFSPSITLMLFLIHTTYQCKAT